MKKCDIGLIGLAVMGQNLVLNMERNGYRVGVYNRTTETTMRFMEGPAAGKQIAAAKSIEELFNLLDRPRKVMVMVKAGNPVDAVIEQLLPFLDVGDLVIDGGNSYYKDTERRARQLMEKGIHYLGAGISGGEEGALWGPSIMPGGQAEAYQMVEGIFEAIAARVDGEPCVTYIGPRGSGHYVKMVHNGIEYGDMQLIAEAYDLLHRGAGLNATELHEVFRDWNHGLLESFLIEITAQIFKRVDEKTGQPLVELIMDEAGQKGTGKWTSQEAFDLGVPVPTINSAVSARILSAYKAERVQAAQVLRGPEISPLTDRKLFVQQVRDALYTAKISSYAQGFAMLRAASEEFNYDLPFEKIAKIWRGGCIIRARFLNDVSDAFRQGGDLRNLLLAPFFRDAVQTHQGALREVVRQAAAWGIPAPGFSASLAYLDGYRSERLPANLIQAQRDLFGAHTYKRVDEEGVFHSDWD